MKTTHVLQSLLLIAAIALGISACGGGNNTGTDLHGTDLAGTDVTGTDLAGTDLAGRDIHGTDVSGTDTTGTDVAGTDTTGTDTTQEDVTQEDVTPTDVPGTDIPPVTGDFTVLAWNNLGMHCYNPSFKTLAVLPPFNTLVAQVIRKGNDPQIVTAGITVEYSFPTNTYSAASTPAKTDFWTYAQDLFGAALAPDVGLTGKGLTGTFDVKGDHFEAEGIPITEFRDQDATVGGNPQTWNRYPYQLATVIVKSTNGGQELTRATVVAPVSSELNCNTCHNDTGAATEQYAIVPSGTNDTDLNILRIHDHLESTNLENQQPVLCAKCHSSNALGAAGIMGVPSLSNAIHNRHDLNTISPNTAGCYECHPGPETRCLRDVMTQEGDVASCQTCHGNMAQVAANANPWLNEPSCNDCHDEGGMQDKPLYALSKTHHGIYCAGCHDSPHAIARSREANDGIKFTELQGHEGPVDTCTVCHTGNPGGSIHSGGDD
jgi:hypothetical protein